LIKAGGAAPLHISRRRRQHEWHVIADAHGDHVARDALARPYSRVETRLDDIDERAIDRNLNAVAYLAQHLIVFIDPADIVANLHHAYRRPEFQDGHYASFHTGPSATADIEGVLIHGAQGVRSLSVVPIERAT
jgi:hypothetical protein